MLRRKWNKNLTSENSLFAINLPEGETHMDPDGKKSWLYGGAQGRRYRVEVPCPVKRYCAELLKSLKDQMILPGTQLKAGTWTQESLCQADALGLGWPISLFLVRAVAVVHEAFECGYREGLSWWQQTIWRQAVYLKPMLWKILAQNVTFAYWNTICKSCLIQRLNLVSVSSEKILHIDILTRNLHLFIPWSSAEVPFYFLPVQREDFLVFYKTNSIVITQKGF